MSVLTIDLCLLAGLAALACVLLPPSTLCSVAPAEWTTRLPDLFVVVFTCRAPPPRRGVLTGPLGLGVEQSAMFLERLPQGDLHVRRPERV